MDRRDRVTESQRGRCLWVQAPTKYDIAISLKTHRIKAPSNGLARERRRFSRPVARVRS